jgi:hypothetical protein
LSAQRVTTAASGCPDLAWLRHHSRISFRSVESAAHDNGTVSVDCGIHLAKAVQKRAGNGKKKRGRFRNSMNAPNSVSLTSTLGLEDVDISRIGAAAKRLIDAIEQGKSGVLWDAASELIKCSIQREAFVAALAVERVTFCRGIDRRWTAARIDRASVAALPPGTYAVLEFSVRMGEPQMPCRETVTLRREEGGIWRLAGYLMRKE